MGEPRGPSTISPRQFSSEGIATKRTAGIVSVEGCVISVIDFAAREEAPTAKTIDLNNFFLPPTKIYPNPTRLGTRDDLVEGVVVAVLGLGRRISPTTKSGAVRVTDAVVILSKFIEFGWLNGLYSWNDWSPVATRRLLKILGSGGWATALELVGRSKQFLGEHSNEQLALMVRPTHSKSGGYSLRGSFRNKLGTNLHHAELIPAKLMILEQLDIELERKETQSNAGAIRPKLQSYEAGMSEGQLRQTLTAINLLAESGDDPPLAFVPFADTVRLSKEHGRSGGRTGNLSPDIVAELLKHSFWWMDEVANPLLNLCEDAMSEIAQRIRDGLNLDSKKLFSAVQAAPAFSRLEGVIGLPITSTGLSWEANDDDISVKQLIYSLATACFLTIAFLNARRKDEIAHRKIGLHRRALRVVNRELGLYECEFFIQKSKKRYVPFYVGDLTRAAIRILERLSDIARAIQRILLKDDFFPEDAREDKLFQLPRFFSKSGRLGSQWYMFRAGGQGHSDYFMSRALNGKPVQIHPHMFRRAYALIHHYRYEHGTLQQLSQQLVHSDLPLTVRYVRDIGTSHKGVTAISYAHADSSIEKLQVDAINEIKGEIANVARERVQELVFQVINDSPRASGGFARLIQRFHQRLGSKIEYQLLSKSAQADMISDSLVNHGHAFRPMRQANCVASSTRRNRSAKCYSAETGDLSRVRASASTCTDCPYSHWVEGHHAAIEADIVALEEELSNDSESVKGRARVIELENIKKVLELRRKRIERMKGQ